VQADQSESRPSLPRTPAQSTASSSVVPDPYPAGYTRYVLFMVLLTMIFSNVDRTILSILVEPIKTDFQLSDTQMGWLLGPAFAVVYTILCLPLGRYADTTGIRRNIVAYSLFVWSLFTCGTSFVTGYAQLFVMRMGVGVGEAGGTSPSVSMLSDYLTPAKRARGISVVSIGAVLGMGIGMVVGGWVSERWGWRNAFLAAGLPGVLLAILYRFTIVEPKRGGSEGRKVVEAPALWPGLKLLLATRTYQFILAANAFSLFASMGRNLWEPAFLMRTYDMGQFEAGAWYFLTAPLPSMFGIFLGGFFADRLGARDPRWFLWVPALGQFASVPLLTIFLLWPETDLIRMPAFMSAAGLPTMPVALVWGLFGSVIGGAYTAPFMSTVQGVSPLRMRAFAAAVSTLVTTLVGLAAGPLLVGVIADSFEERFGEDALRYSLLVPTLTPLIAAVICLFGARFVGADLARARSTDR
jgi:MFS family permease